MNTQNIIAVLWVISIVGGCAQSSALVTAPENRVAPSNGPNVSKGTTFMNGGILNNGAILANGKSRALALTNLASRPLAKKD